MSERKGYRESGWRANRSKKKVTKIEDFNLFGVKGVDFIFSRIVYSGSISILFEQFYLFFPNLS
jgi:hypothetical protein